VDRDALGAFSQRFTDGGSGRCSPAIPRYARRNRPTDTSAPMIRWVVALIGTASPRPIPATAVLSPTSRPRQSTSAPPELPGLSAASVWMTFSTTRVAAPSGSAATGRAR
jgi:hypothetical protein